MLQTAPSLELSKPDVCTCVYKSDGWVCTKKRKVESGKRGSSCLSYLKFNIFIDCYYAMKNREEMFVHFVYAVSRLNFCYLFK